MYNIIRFLIGLVLLMVFAACSPSNLKEFRNEGRRLNQSLLEELQLIRTRENAIVAKPRLEKIFCYLADAMVEAKQHEESYPLEPFPALTEEDHALSEALRRELNRIYQIEGTREIVEKSQELALRRLSK